MSHLGFIRGFSYSKTDFICTLFRWIMHGYPMATLQHGISGYEFRWSAGFGVRDRLKWVRSGIYGSKCLVRRGKQYGVTLSWWYLLIIHRFREEIRRSDLNWLNLAVTLLKALFGLWSREPTS